VGEGKVGKEKSHTWLNPSHNGLEKKKKGLHTHTDWEVVIGKFT